jgi:hypothetical protein
MDQKISVKKLPKYIVILGRKFKIKQLVGLCYHGEPCLGLCDASNKIIYLEKGQKEDDKLDTLVHESVHAMLSISGIDQKLTDSENEIMCQLVTALFNDLLKSLKLKQ